MLLRIFKTSQPLSWILILSLLIIGRAVLFSLFFDLSYLPENVSISGDITHYLALNQPWISHILGTLILIPSGFIFNKIAQDIPFFKGIHYLLFFFFALFSVYSPANLVLTPFLLSIPILLLALAMTLSQSKGKISLATIFNASFLIGIGTLLYFPNIILFGMLLISLFYLSKITWRSFFVVFIGLFTSFLFHDALAFSFHHPSYYLSQSIHLYLTPFTTEYFTPLISSVAFITLSFIQLPLFYSTSAKSIIKIRKSLFLILFTFILGLVFALFIQSSSGQWVNIIFLPISIVFSLFHMEVKKWWLGDLAFLGLLTCIVMNYLPI